ncbi:hypothetical protein EVAR_90665_1 [Eumeta japonica]|uniref:Uncharacterized protein n=1 Tax=Eumeta variegata TaxID=151549 RepID=A0A4C1ZDB2_EUMVA|nr:hypothetical protein EVAR_90665_1 [Eumeta japonica]
MKSLDPYLEQHLTPFTARDRCVGDVWSLAIPELDRAHEAQASRSSVCNKKKDFGGVDVRSGRTNATCLQGVFDGLYPSAKFWPIVEELLLSVLSVF